VRQFLTAPIRRARCGSRSATDAARIAFPVGVLERPAPST